MLHSRSLCVCAEGRRWPDPVGLPMCAGACTHAPETAHKWRNRTGTRRRRPPKTPLKCRSGGVNHVRAQSGATKAAGVTRWESTSSPDRLVGIVTLAAAVVNCNDGETVSTPSPPIRVPSQSSASQSPRPDSRLLGENTPGKFSASQYIQEWGYAATSVDLVVAEGTHAKNAGYTMVAQFGRKMQNSPVRHHKVF